MLANGKALTMFDDTGGKSIDNLADALVKTRSFHWDLAHFDPAVTPAHKLVLFHYATLSWIDFRRRKAGTAAGLFTSSFRARCEARARHNSSRRGKQHEAKMQAQCFEDLQHDWGYDTDAPICAAAASYASACCRSG